MEKVENETSYSSNPVRHFHGSIPNLLPPSDCRQPGPSTNPTTEVKDMEKNAEVRCLTQSWLEQTLRLASDEFEKVAANASECAEDWPTWYAQFIFQRAAVPLAAKEEHLTADNVEVSQRRVRATWVPVVNNPRYTGYNDDVFDLDAAVAAGS